MGNSFYFGWEPVFMQWLQNALGETGVKVMSVLSVLGEEYIIVAVFAFLYLAFDKQSGVYIGTTLMTALVANPMIKNIFLRRRPYFDHPEVKCFKPVDRNADIYDVSAQGFSFPSGHSTNTATFYGAVSARFKKRWIYITAVVISLFVGVLRVALGAHYPTDVFMSYAVGAAIIFGIGILQRKVRRQWVVFLTLLVPAGCGFIYCRSNDYFNGLGLMIGFFGGVLFERKFVNFSETRYIPQAILRVGIGAGIFFGLNTLLKLPFSEEFLASATIGQYLLRTIRYAVVIFFLAGVYPKCFPLLDRIFPDKAKRSGKEQ